jgi:RND family efflux transporter MFP subunit
MEVTVTPFSEVLTAIGTSRALRSIVVTSDVAGEIAESHLEANRLVSAGDLLVRLTSDLEEIEVTIAETELASARQTLERYTTLDSASRGAVAGMTLQDAETAVALAEANLAKARQALGRLTVTAPIAGRLGLPDLLVGGRIAAGAEIVTIDDTSRIIVSFEMPERAIDVLEVGRDVQATTPAFAGRVLKAAITAFDSRIDETTRTVTVEAEIDNAEGRLWPGMSFSVQVPNESAPLPQVTATALVWTADGAQVWAVRDGAATAVPVTVRMRQDESVWVEGDLRAGEWIVADGSARLREGAPIEVQKDSPPNDSQVAATRSGDLPQDDATAATDEEGQTSDASTEAPTSGEAG